MKLHAQHGEAEGSFSKEEYDQRFERARKLMATTDMDALLISQNESHHYFAGLTYYDMEWSRFVGIWPCFTLIPRDGEPEVIAHHVYQTNARLCYEFNNVELWVEGDSEEEPEYVRILQDRIKKLGLDRARIGCEWSDNIRMDLPYRDLERLVGKLPECEFVDGSPVLQDLRMIKSEAEVAYIRKACDIQDQAIANLRERICAGMMGSTVRNILRGEVGKLGGRPIWELGSHFGGQLRSRGPEGGRDVPLQRGEIFNFDMGILYGAYHADYGRTWVVGEPGGGQRRDHEDTVRVLEATLGACGPRVLITDVIHACRDAIEDLGAKQDLTISASQFLGHGVGLNMMEPPYLSLYSTGRLEPGMVLALEPAITSDYGWFNIEQMILITKDGHDLLSRAPDDFFQIR